MYKNCRKSYCSKTIVLTVTVLYGLVGNSNVPAVYGQVRYPVTVCHVDCYLFAGQIRGLF